MDTYLRDRKPMVLGQLTESYDDGYNTFLQNQGPKVLKIVKDSTAANREEFTENNIIIPPLNTDIRFSRLLPKYDPTYTSDVSEHPQRPHLHDSYAENFSWHIIDGNDNAVTSSKKRLMQPIQNQYMCGSCWAMALAACVSDCFVVGGNISWMPMITPTYLMMVIPPSVGNGQCNGGNPASVTLALEDIPVCDSTCIDYSWCSNDTELCTSASAASHFQSSFGQKLNDNIPSSSSGACYFAGNRYTYEINKGSNVFFINNQYPVEMYRAAVKAHIVDFGPPLAGYAVLRNFVTGNFTDPNINQGIYFDRASYPASISSDKQLTFSDSNASEANLSGLHAVRVVGWGMGKNVQYDNNKYGDVPYWWVANSWGNNWGNSNGYFKMAMYPFNKFAQFDAQSPIQGYPVGGMILIRCTSSPKIMTKDQIKPQYFDKIKRSQPDSFYKMTPDEISKTIVAADTTTPNSNNYWIYISIGAAILIAAFFLIKMNKKH
jgi:hypothetical protein